MVAGISRILARWRLNRQKLGGMGTNVVICPGYEFDKPENIRIGNNVHIGPHAWISAIGGLIIEDGVIMGPRVRIYTANHRYDHADAVPYDDVVLPRPVHIHRNVWVGGDVLIVPGVNVGEGAVLAAGAVVVSDVPPCHVVGGNPAKTIKVRDREHYDLLKQRGRVYLGLKREGAMSPRLLE